MRRGEADRRAMESVERLRRGVQELHAIECGVAHVLDGLEEGARHPRVASVAGTLAEAADRHMEDLARICEEERWSDGGCEAPEVQAWSRDVESLEPDRSGAGDRRRLELLGRAVSLKLPRYLAAREFALLADRPAHARVLRLAHEDEKDSAARIACLEEMGGPLGSA